MRGQRMLRRHRAERDPHDGVGTRGEHIHAAIADQLPGAVADIVGERKAHTLTLANPVILHQLDALGPTRQAGADMVQQLLRVVGDLEVVARDLALFHHRTGAPALAIDHLLVGQHGLVHRIPVDDLGFAVRDALVQHLQEQPLVPLVVARVASGHLA